MADPDITLLGKNVQTLQVDMRAIKRELAMLRAQQSELPTVAQFQAGLDALDARISEAQQETMAAIRELTALVQSKLP